MTTVKNDREKSPVLNRSRLLNAEEKKIIEGWRRRREEENGVKPKKEEEKSVLNGKRKDTSPRGTGCGSDSEKRNARGKNSNVLK